MSATDEKSARIPELDGVRGLAIFLILMDHYVEGAVVHGGGGVFGTLIRDVFSLAWSGVDLFFVLSGFLIGGILIDRRDSPHYFKTFYIRRACRILPFYLLWIFLFFIFAWLFSDKASSGWYNILFRRLPHFPDWGYFTFLQNFHIAKLNDFGPAWTGISWSLCIEEQFYLLMPLILWFSPPKQLPVVLVSLLLAVAAFRISLYLSCSALGYVLLPCRADGLLLGVLCAYAVRHPAISAWLKRRRDWLYLGFAVLFAGTVYLAVLARSLDQETFADFTSFEMNCFGYSWLDAFYACLLLLVITVRDNPLARAMRFSWLRHLGIISYSIYLIHGTINDSLQCLILGRKPWAINSLSEWMVTLLAFFVTWILAMVSWKYFEKPIIRWGHSFSYGDSKVLPEEPTALEGEDSEKIQPRVGVDGAS